MAEYLKFRLVHGSEIVRKSKDQVFGVTGCGYDSRSAALYRVGDYLLIGCSSPAISPDSMTLERIVAMEIIPGAPEPCADSNPEPEPACA